MPYFKKLVKGVAANLGANHEALRNVRMKLAHCAMRAQSYKLAKKNFLKLLRDKLLMERLSAPSEVVSEEADVRLQLAVAMAHLAENKAGLEQIEAAKQLVGRYFGQRDMRYAKVLNGAAGVMERLNRDEDALRNMEVARFSIAGMPGAPCTASSRTASYPHGWPSGTAPPGPQPRRASIPEEWEHISAKAWSARSRSLAGCQSSPRRQPRRGASPPATQNSAVRAGIARRGLRACNAPHSGRNSS
jgi:hypothetical protein